MREPGEDVWPQGGVEPLGQQSLNLEGPNVRVRETQVVVSSRRLDGKVCDVGGRSGWRYKFGSRHMDDI